MTLHTVTDTMIETAAKNAETIAYQSRTIHNLIVDNDRLRTELAAANAKVAEQKVITEREEVLFALLFSTAGHRWLAQEADNREQSITLNQFFVNEIKEAFAIAVESDGFVEINEETVAAVFHDITGGDFAEFMKGEGWPE